MFTLYMTIVFINIIMGIMPFLIERPQLTKGYFQKKIAHFSYLFLAFSLAFWTFCVYKFWHGVNVVLWSKLAFVGPVILPFAFLIFVLHYPQKIIDYKKRILTLLFIPTTIFLLLTPTTPFIVETVLATKKIQYGIGHRLFVAYFVIYALITLSISFWNYRQMKGINRLRLKYFFAGGFFATLVGVTTNIALPIFGIHQYNKFGPISSLVMMVFILYSMLKHRLMDITLVIRKSFAIFLSLFLAILGFYFCYQLFFHTQGYFSQALSPKMMISKDQFMFLFASFYWIGVCLIFPTLRLKLQTTAAKSFLKGRANYQQVLIDVSQALACCTAIGDLIETLKAYFVDELDIQDIRVLLPESFQKKRGQIHLFYEWNIDIDNTPMIDGSVSYSKDKYLFLEELFFEQDVLFISEAPEKIVAEYKAINIECAVPCFARKKMSAVLLIGPKLSEDAYTDEDYTFLKTLSSQVAVAIERIRPFERVKQDYQKSLDVAEKISQQASYATLTRGIAHEINNPMGMMLSGLELLVENMNDKALVKKYSGIIKDNILRITRLTRTMLRYGSPVSQQRSSVDINTILEEVLLMAKNRLKKERIKVNKMFGESIPLLVADSDSLHNAFVNLLLNSLQAMSAGGVLTVRTKLEGYIDQDGAETQGVRVEISDTGKGMSQEIKDKVFDPFFTTKHENTGIGLSIVMRIIGDHNGTVDVQSEEGKGTTFILHLPLG